MTGADQGLHCLICSVPITHAHLGIDSCRACAVFYKRTLNHKRPIKCKGGANDCLADDYSCRKCRYERFKEVFDKACAGEQPDWKKKENSRDESLTESEESLEEEQSVEEPSPSFMDHESYFECLPSCADTPLLERMKRAYCTLCLVRKSGEMGAMRRSVAHDMLMQDKLTLHPAKYSTVVEYSRIFISGIIDYARASFDDFRNLSAESRYFIVQRNFKLMQSLDGAYRGHNLFPNDNTVMASYLTYVNDETVEQFFEDCPYAVNKKEAAELFSKNMKRTAVPNRTYFRKVKPSGGEFVALFGLVLWNDNTASISAELAQLVTRNRAAIMDELHKLYASRGFTDYAARLGELLCLLVNVESALEVTNEDIEVYRMMNLFNEAFEDAPRVLPIDRMQF